MNLYFYFCNVYEEAEKAGHWKTWDEESAFPHEEYAFESAGSHTTRGVDGVFDGFDFNGWAEQELVNGLEGTKAVEVCAGPVKKKTMIWEASLCGVGLENKIKEAISDHVDEQGAMTASARKKKKVNISNDITVFFAPKAGNGKKSSIFSVPTMSKSGCGSTAVRRSAWITSSLCLSRMTRIRRDATTDHPACVRVRVYICPHGDRVVAFWSVVISRRASRGCVCTRRWALERRG